MFRRAIEKYIFLSAVLIPTLSFFVQDAWSSSAQIFLKNDSSSDMMIQVKDEVCKLPKDIECNNARTLLQSQQCQQNPFSNDCKMARVTVDSACTCAQARNTLKSRDCQLNPGSQICKEANDKIKSSSCMEGFIFEGIVGRGAKIPLLICLSPSGYGHISVSEIRSSYWKSYHLISAGDTVSYP